MNTATLLENLDAFAYREALASGEAVVLIPVGSLEQHGRHLPLGTDTILSSHIASGVAQRLGALVAQPIAYGYKSQQKSGGGNHLAGTTSAPFEAGTHRRIAVKVIDDRGNELLVVRALGGGL